MIIKILFVVLLLGRSPVFGHFSTTLLGLDTIRAFGVEQTFSDQLYHYQDEHTKAWMTFISSSAWLSYRLDLLCVIFISFVALVSPTLRDGKYRNVTPPVKSLIFCVNTKMITVKTAQAYATRIEEWSHYHVLCFCIA